MSDKYTSLEHIIRNIAEGRFTPSDQPKVNLEHVIRNVHEAVGVSGKDKPEGTPSAFLTRHYHSQGGNIGGRFAGNNTSAGKGVVAKQKQADPIKMESAPSDMSGITIATEDGKKKDVKEISDVGADTTPVASWPAAESGKKKIKEEILDERNQANALKRKIMDTLAGARYKLNNPVPAPEPEHKTAQAHNKAIGRALRSEENSEQVDEGSVYHVSWGPGLEHEVVAKHGDEAISKAKDHLISKSPKLKDQKYSDTFSKKPNVHNMSNERRIQKEDSSVPYGTKERRKVVNVGRPDTAENPFDVKSKLVKQAEIKAKIIDEAAEKEKIKLEKGKTQIEFKPTLKTPSAADKVNETKEPKMSEETTNPLIAAFLKLQEANPSNMFEAAKHLSDKQKKIAKIAGDKNKIGADDLAALRAGKKMEEEVEQIDEIGDTKAGRDRLKEYIKRAGGGTTNSAVAHQSLVHDAKPGGELHKTSIRKTKKRVKGVERAADRLESVEQIDELDKKTIKSYQGKATTSGNRAHKTAEREEDKAMSTDGSKHPEKQARHQAAASDASKTLTKRQEGLKRAEKKVGSDPHKHRREWWGEDVDFSEAELAHFDSVFEAVGESKDATQKGSFKKAGSSSNGDPVRSTVPDRDLTD